MKTVGIIENDATLRDSLVDYLTFNLEKDVVFTIGSAKEMQTLRVTDVDVILLDIHLDDAVGLELIDPLKVKFPHTNIVIITGDSEEKLILNAIKLGANGYLYKPFDGKKMQTMLSNIEQTGSFMDPETLTKLMTQLANTNAYNAKEKIVQLTPTERKIVELAKKGSTYKEMAKTIGVSFHTINFHLKSIYLKYDVRSKAELIAKFL